MFIKRKALRKHRRLLTCAITHIHLKRAYFKSLYCAKTPALNTIQLDAQVELLDKFS